VIVLETQRLLLRHMRVDDAPFILELRNTPASLRFIGNQGVNTLEDAKHYILTGPLDMIARLGFGFYIVELKDTGEPIGACGLAKRDFLDDVDIGFNFLERSWGQGYAYEAAAAVRDYARDALDLPRLVATTRVDNHASARLLEKLGLCFEREIMHPDGDRQLRIFALDLS
jgi:RimJ/RimL family protein N-acetyltransferase